MIGGIVSSLAGIAWRNYTQRSGQAQRSGAHGASGAIYSVISFFACMSPNATFLLFGIVPMPAWAMVTGIFLYDGYSAVNHQVSLSLACSIALKTNAYVCSVLGLTQLVTSAGYSLVSDTSSQSVSGSFEWVYTFFCRALCFR